MRKWMKRNRVELILYFGFVLLHLILMQAAKMPLMYGDERGYIGWARKLVYGISDGVRYLPGYSFFLIPVFAITNKISLAYPLILAVNGFLGGLIPVGVYRLGKVFDLSEKNCILCGVVCALYPAYLMYANMALCEILLTTLFVLLILQFGLLSQAPNKKWGWIRLGFLTILLLATHTRALVVLPALAVSLPLLFSRRHQKKAWVITGITVLITIGAAFFFLSGNNTNTIHLKEQIAGLFTSRGIKDFLYAVLSQGTYLLCSTFFLAAIGLWQGIRMIVKKEKGWETAWYILTCWGCLFLLSCIYMSHHEKPVHIIYGRYNDCMTFALLFLGMVSILQKKSVSKWLLIPVLFAVLVTGWKQAPLLAGGNAGAELARISLGSVDSEIAQVFGIGLYRMVLEQFDYWQMLMLYSILALVLYLIGRKCNTASLVALCGLFLVNLCYTDVTFFHQWSQSRNTPSEVLGVLKGNEHIKVIEQEENGLGYAWEYDRYLTEQPTLSIDVEEKGQELLLTRQSGYDLPLLAMEQDVNVYLWARNEETAKHYEGFIMNRGEEKAKITLSAEGTVTLTSEGNSPLVCYASAKNIQECVAVLAVWYDKDGNFLYSDRLELPMNLYQGKCAEWQLQVPEEANQVYLRGAKEYNTWIGEGSMYEIRNEKGQTRFVPIQKQADELTLSFRRIELSHMKEGIEIQNTTWKPNLIGFSNGKIGEESRISNISCPVPERGVLAVYAQKGQPLEVLVNGVSLGTVEWSEGCYRYALEAEEINEITFRYPVKGKSSNVKLLNRFYQNRFDGLEVTQIVVESEVIKQ